MNITFIILSLCLTLKVTSIEGQNPALIKIIAKSYLAGLGMLGTIQAVKQQVENKLQDVLDFIQPFQDDAKKKSGGISDQVELIEKGILLTTRAILVELKMKDVMDIFVQIDRKSEVLGQKINSNGPSSDNNSAMLDFLHNFIEDFELLNLDSYLLERLDSFALGSTSLTDVLVQTFQQFQSDNVSQLRQSTNKFLNEFYFLIMKGLEDSHSLLSVTNIFYAYYGGEISDSDSRYLEEKKKKINRRLYESWEKARIKIYNINDYVSYCNLNNSVEDVRFKRLLQTYFSTERNMKGHCKGSCKDIVLKEPFNDIYCKGSMNNCYDVLDLYQTGSVTYSSDNTRIYERYELQNRIFGRKLHGNAFTKERVKLEQRYIHSNYGSLCDQCRCTCDQISNKNTVRSFYIGRIEPEEKGFVITGVRFADLNKTIYLEIEIGQMLPFGFVNASTCRWQGPPKDLVTNVIAFNFKFFCFHLDKVHIKNGFLSGFEMFSELRSLRLRVFSRSFENFTEGIISDKEEIHIDDKDVHQRLHLNDKNCKVSKRPGRITTNEKYNVCFGTSNQDTDAGQSMVPYFDATDITFDEKSALGGIGFMHHSSSMDYAGYIRPLIYSLHYNYLDLFFDEEDDYES